MQPNADFLNAALFCVPDRLHGRCSFRSSGGCFLGKAQQLLIIHNPVTQCLHKKAKLLLFIGRKGVLTRIERHSFVVTLQSAVNYTRLRIRPRLVLCGPVRLAVFKTNLHLIRHSLLHIGGQQSVSKMGKSLTRKIFLLHGILEKVADETHEDKGLCTLGVSGQ